MDLGGGFRRSDLWKSGGGGAFQIQFREHRFKKIVCGFVVAVVQDEEMKSSPSLCMCVCVCVCGFCPW